MLVRKSTEIALVRRIKKRRRGGSIAQVAHNLSNLRAFYAIFVTSISGHKAHPKPAHKTPCLATGLHACECVFRIYMQIEATHTPALSHTHVHTLKVTQAESIVALVRYFMRFST